MKLFNSLTRKIEEFEPFGSAQGKPDNYVGVYTCGPTVYDYVTIGNWRTYTLGDLVFRVLGYLGYQVDYVMNVTDVGHLTGDNMGDADIGQDRMEQAAKKANKTAWELAEFYTQDFYHGYEALNLTKPKVWCKATDHIAEQIAAVQAIEAKGFTYRIDDGIYFDTRAYEAAGNSYGELSTLDQVKVGARVEPNLQKKDERDFALWKFSPKDVKRQMEWESPWGVGFPGWHTECSAMSMKYLGPQFEIHVGGEDLRSTHHPNEIAQAEAVTGEKPFVKYWVHGAFLQVDGGRMGKSLGNAFRLRDLTARGFSAMDLRYFYLTGHYRKPLNFTWRGLKAAQTARNSLVQALVRFKDDQDRVMLSEEKMAKVQRFQEEFRQIIGDDLNLPQSLGLMWMVVKSNIPNRDKYDLLIDFDQVWGLGLAQAEAETIPEAVEKRLQEREELRAQGRYTAADQIRQELLAQGWVIEDQAGKSTVTRRELSLPT